MTLPQGPRSMGEGSPAGRPSTAGIGAALVQVLGVAALVGAVLHAAKGAVLVVGGPDLSLVPTFTFLFATGISGFYLRLGGGQRGLGIAGLTAAGAASIGGLAGLVYQAQGVAPEDLGAPLGVSIAYLVGTFGILVGLLLLGVATHRAASLPSGWRTTPLIAGIVWFPLEGLTVVLPDGWGLLAAGLAWMAAAFCLIRPVPAVERPAIRAPRQ